MSIDALPETFPGRHDVRVSSIEERGGNAREQDEVKAWLRKLLADSKWSKAALAREFGVEPKTITNAFSGRASLPRGLTFYRLLRELGALRPDAPGSSETIAARLQSLEGKVDGLATNEDLERTLAVVLEAIHLQANPDTQTGSSARKT